jgi:uncharacterized protein (TIGR02266 family)
MAHLSNGGGDIMADNTILISPAVRKLLHIDDSFAAHEGFNLLTAQDTSDLFVTARAQHPDIIFITPDDSAGHDPQSCCCRLLRDDPDIGDIPIIAIIDGNNKVYLNRCQMHKPQDILFTPLSRHLFLAAARRALGLPHRSFDRLQTSLKVDFGTGRNNLRPACAYNLSTGGIFIATESEYLLNSKIIVKLDLPEAGTPIICESVVSWINHSDDPEQPEIPPGIGLQFLSLNAADLSSIHRFISERRNSS